MGTVLLEVDDFQVTQFWGGEKRGRCLQLDNATGSIQLTMDQYREMLMCVETEAEGGVMARVTFDTNDQEMINAVWRALVAFGSGEISLEQWLAMPRGERSALAGAVAGNAAMHHPEVTYHILRAHFPAKRGTPVEAMQQCPPEKCEDCK